VILRYESGLQGEKVMAEGFNPTGVVKPFGIFSSAAWQPEGKVLHISGQVAQDEDGKTVGLGDIKVQTRQTLKNIETVLKSVGGLMSDVVKITVFLTDISTLQDVHAVRAEFFQKPYPASTLVQVTRLVNRDWLIEIEAVAVIPHDKVRLYPA
jgi:2-iminobutanoate/2-iminopropanoate deaminase